VQHKPPKPVVVGSKPTGPVFERLVAKLWNQGYLGLLNTLDTGKKKLLHIPTLFHLIQISNP